MTDRPFYWILGSGASVQSGIPSGGKLAQQWLAEMHEMENGGQLPIEQWATADTLGIAGFDYTRLANFYPWIYQRRFRDYKEQGYAFLEKVMDKAEPSFGYSVLAQIMATTSHSVAVTTNFDNLIADALAIHTRTFPLVCGHVGATLLLGSRSGTALTEASERVAIFHYDEAASERITGTAPHHRCNLICACGGTLCSLSTT